MSDMTKNEFKQGDIVRLKPKDQLPDWLKNDSGLIVEVAAYYPDEDRYCMKFGNQYHTVKGEYFELCPREVYIAQRRKDFLTELQALLRKYNAEICGGLSDISEKDVVFILIGDNDKVKYLNGTSVTYAHITADNIMDFDKE